jgi:NAD(P)-dependent dehydrogenase (short-subunit alcohol dehydrogenase family)
MGARVIVTYRQRADEAAAVVADCEAATPGARAEPLDLLEEDSVRALFDRVRDAATATSTSWWPTPPPPRSSRCSS